MMDTFGIAAQPFSKVVGLGEITINRYINGRTPSKSISDKLYSIKKDFYYFEELLEENKDEITSTAYKKSKNNIEKLKSLYDKSDINQVALYFWYKNGDITKMALQKLLYFSNGLYYAIYHEKLFDDQCKAWKYGPVYQDVYNRYKDSDERMIGNINEDFYNLSVSLSKEQREFLDVICHEFGRYSGYILSEMTHLKDTPWAKTRVGLDETDGSDIVIEDSLINAYFESVVKKYNISKDNLEKGIEVYCSNMLKSIP